MILVDIIRADFQGARFGTKSFKSERTVELPSGVLGCRNGEQNSFQGRILLGGFQKRGDECPPNAVAALRGSNVNRVNAALMLILQSFFAHEGCGADQLAVFEGAEVEIAIGGFAKALRDGFHTGGTEFFRGFAESEGVGFESFETNLPPGRGIVVVEDAYFHALHSKWHFRFC